MRPLPPFSLESDQKSGGDAPIEAVHARPEEAKARPSRLSFQEIFAQHAHYLWRALLGLGVPERDVDDACQEVLLVAYRRLDDIEPATLRSWLYGVCIRVASGHRRKLRTRREAPAEQLPELSTADTPYEAVAARSLETQLMCALDELDDSKRAAFVLYEIEELTLREIAEALECPLQTAYSRLEAARAHVRKSLSEGGRA